MNYYTEELRLMFSNEVFNYLAECDIEISDEILEYLIFKDDLVIKETENEIKKYKKMGFLGLSKLKIMFSKLNIVAQEWKLNSSNSVENFKLESQKDVATISKTKSVRKNSTTVTNQHKNIVIDNRITRSAQNLTLVEKRILAIALTKPEQFTTEIKITAQEYADTYGVNIKGIYQTLVENADKLMNKKFIIYDDINNHKTTYNWMSKSDYSYNNGYIQIRFNQDVLPFMQMLSKYFTKYKVEQISKLNSVYSWRLLELFESVRKSTITKKDKEGNTLITKKSERGWLKITIDEFHHVMETPDNYKNDFNALKRRVIESSIKELSEKDGWIIEYRTIKKGLKVAMLEFEFERKEKKPE